MASTFVNDLRLEEIGDGEQSTTWGATTNTNLELIAEAFSYGTENLSSDGDATITIADGTSDEARSLYLKITSTSLTATRTITFAPNTLSKVWIIENATTGSQSITIKQGSGATVTIPNGQVKAIATDGAGSGAAVFDLFQDISIPDLFIDDDLTVGDDINLLSDSAVINFGADSDVTLTHLADSGLTVSAGANDTVLQIISTAADAGVAPNLILTRDSSSPADNDLLGTVVYQGDNDAAENTVYTQVFARASDVSDGTEDGEYFIQTMTAGSLVTAQQINGTSTTFAGDITVGDDVNLLSDASVLSFGADQDVTLTHVADTGLLLNSTSQLQFNDASQNITAPNATTLDINATDEIELNATAIDINGTADVSGTLTTAAITASGTVSPNSDSAVDLGTDSVYWRDAYIDSIATTGSVFIGRASAYTETSRVAIEFNGAGAMYGITLKPVSSGTTHYLHFLNNSGTTVGNISSDMSTVSYNTTSDYRLKENIVDMSGAIDRVKALKPKRFNFKTNTSKTIDGFLAHETQQVVPEAVTGEKDGLLNGEILAQSMDQSKLIPLLTGALQEALAEIDALKVRVAFLEGK